MVLLLWTPPYDWAWMVGSLQACVAAGVERLDEGGYSRSSGIKGHRRLIHLAPDGETQGLRVTLSPGLQPVAEICYAQIGQLFGLAYDPRQVAGALGSLTQVQPGLRLSEALDAFEQAVRAVLGQLVGVATAARLTAKMAADWGEPLAGASGYTLFPTPETLSQAGPQALKALGVSLWHAKALTHLTRAALSGELPLTAPTDIDAELRQLQSLPEISRWTANYFTLRGWQAKDIFLPDDYLIKQHFPGMTPTVIARYARHRQPM